jgi:hypothetical protein
MRNIVTVLKKAHATYISNPWREAFNAYENIGLFWRELGSAYLAGDPGSIQAPWILKNWTGPSRAGCQGFLKSCSVPCACSWRTFFQAGAALQFRIPRPVQVNGGHHPVSNFPI